MRPISCKISILLTERTFSPKEFTFPEGKQSLKKFLLQHLSSRRSSEWKFSIRSWRQGEKLRRSEEEAKEKLLVLERRTALG